MPSKTQIIKCRDDKNPVILSDADESTGERRLFQLAKGSACSWLKADEVIGSDKIRPRVEPWLTALFQSEHLSLLAGSGLSHAVHYVAAESSLPGMSYAKFATYQKEIDEASKISSSLAGRKEGNIEDQLRVANELLGGLRILKESSKDGLAKLKTLADDIKQVMKDFSQSILDGECKLLTSDESKQELAFNYLVSFLMSFASRSGTRERLQIFTTNYDRFIEAGAELAGLHLLDRFVGSLAPIFRASRLDIDMHYNPPGMRGEPRYLEGVAKFCKLHGSVDWINVGHDIRRIGIPFGASSIEPYLSAPGLRGADTTKLMIYPNAAKDRETASYPYVELFRDFAVGVCRPNGVLITYGYSFGDEHVNRVIEDMLTIPSTHLVIIAHGDTLGRIMRTYDKLGRHAQISIMLGDHLGDLRSLVDNYLPKPAIDRTTFRMSELLKARWAKEGKEIPDENRGFSSPEVSI